MPETVIDLLAQTAHTHGRRPALGVRHGSTWDSISWSAYHELVRRTARGFMALGLGPGGGVSILSANRPEWFFADLGAVAAGCVPAGIYSTCTAEQCAYIITHSESRAVVVETAEHVERIQSARGAMPGLETIISLDPSAAGPDVVTWNRLQDLGAEVDDEDLDARLSEIDTNDLCTLIYTSGTTGPPKAVMLSHRNLLFASRTGSGLFGVDENDRVVSYLPLSHIAEQLFSLYIPLASGASSWFVESVEVLRERLTEVEPTLFLGVPRVWEKIQAAIQAAGAESSGLKKRIGAWARSVGAAALEGRQHGRPAPFTYSIADRVVFSKVRERLGLSKARGCFTGAAPISPDTLKFFGSLGIPIYNIYGLSENTGGATASLPSAFRLGTAGRALPGTEVRIGEDGEVLIRGPHVFLGYYKDAEATAQALDADGWLHTGDVGTIDDDGYLTITDRIKDLLITSGGKNVAPQLLEAELKSIDGVGQAVVIGDGRKYLAALLTIDAAGWSAAALRAGSPAQSPDDAAACPRYREYVERAVEDVNAGLARYETIKRFTLLPEDFTPESGELTPTMKIKRRVVRERYAREIEAMYEG